MNQALPWLLGLALAILVAWGIRHFRHEAAQQDQAYAQGAATRGWRYARNPSFLSTPNAPPNDDNRGEAEDIAWTFHGGRDGLAWRMWFDAGLRERPPTPRAVWHCEALRAAGIAVWIVGRGRYRRETDAVVGAIEGATDAVSRAITGTARTDSLRAFRERAVPVAATRPGFDEAYVALAGPEMPADWLDDETQRLLMDWSAALPAGADPEAIEVTLDAQGLRVVYQAPPKDAWAFWDQFGRLGEVLLRRLARDAANPAYPAANPGKR